MTTRAAVQRQSIDGRSLELGRHGVQAAVIATYEAIGCTVVRTAQSYRRGKRLNPGTPGLADLYVFPPAADHLSTNPWWHETKREGGKQRPEQVDFQQLCEERGVAYVLGGVFEALEHLKRLGLIA